MAAPRTLIAALYRHGAASAGNKTQLETFKSEALTEIATNKGGSVLSGSANGVNFALGGAGSLSVGDWFAALDVALQWVDKGIAPPSQVSSRII